MAHLHKKGFSGETTLLLFRVLVAIFAIGILVNIVNGTIKESLELNDLRFYSIAERFLYSQSCFVKEENGRPLPGIIVSSRFSDKILQKCMVYVDKPIGVKLTLNDDKTLYYNQETFDSILPLKFSNKYKYVKRRFLVFVDDKPGNLLVEVAWRK